MTYQQYRPQGFRMLPPVVKNLLILNGLFYLATIGLGTAYNIDLVDILGLHYFSAEKFQFYQLFTYMFMHGSFMHLFFNMFALWMFGCVLENVWGTKRFIIYYFVTGIGAAVVHYVIFYFELKPVTDAINLYLANPGAEQLKHFIESGNIDGNYEPLKQFIQEYNTLLTQDLDKAIILSKDFVYQYRIDLLNMPVVVGASGAVFGILLAFGMMFPNTLIYVYFAIPIKAKWFVIIYGVLELISGISNRSGDNVAHFAHLGGMLFGFILLMIWKKQAKNRNHYE